MKTQQEIRNHLIRIKQDLYHLECYPSIYAEDDIVNDVLASVASINDDLIDMLSVSKAEVQTEAIEYRDICNLRMILNDCEDFVQQVSTEDFKKLKVLVDDLWYKKKLVDFIKHLDSALLSTDDSDEACDEFYATDWTITFGNKSIKVYNTAAIYNGVYDALKEILDNEI